MWWGMPPLVDPTRKLMKKARPVELKTDNALARIIPESQGNHEAQDS